MGMFDINDTTERANILDASSYVDGYCIGNEGIPNRYSLESLRTYTDALKQTTHKPISTSEEGGDYYAGSEIIQFGDWVYPNVHPYWAHIYDATDAANWTQQQYVSFTNLAPGKFVIFREVGYPTEEDPLSNETLQKDYYAKLAQQPGRFTKFEGFDQYWKGSGVEPHWGFYERDRTPKLIVSFLPFTK